MEKPIRLARGIGRTRVKVLEFLASRPPCLVVMETCDGVHHWDRGIQQLGHEVRSIAPVYVKLFVKRRQKSGARDSAAIVEAAHRPMMQFVRKPNPRPPHLRPCPDCARGYTTAPLRLASRALRPPPPS